MLGLREDINPRQDHSLTRRAMEDGCMSQTQMKADMNGGLKILS